VTAPRIFVAALLASILAACASPYVLERKTADELFADAGTDIRDGNGRGAITKLEYLKTKYPDFPDREGVDFRLAEARRVNGDLWRAFVEFREFLQRYPITSLSSRIESNLFEIGRQLLDSRWSFLGTGLFREADDGVAVLYFLVDNFPHGPKADDALRRVAQYKFLARDYAGAVADYERIIRAYPSSAWRDLAEYRIGIAYLRSVERADLDRSALLKAREALGSYLATRPEGSSLEEARAALYECDEKLAESEFRIGEFYRRIDEPFGARLHYRNAVIGYPVTQYAARAEARLAEMPPGEIPLPLSTASRKASGAR